MSWLLAWLRTEPVLAHKPQNPRLGGAGALVTQACPDLAVTFSVELAVGDDLHDFFDQLCV